MVGQFRTSDRDTPMLMSPSLQDWLPAKHLARLIVETVESLDLRAIEDSYNRMRKKSQRQDSARIYRRNAGRWSRKAAVLCPKSHEIFGGTGWFDSLPGVFPQPDIIRAVVSGYAQRWCLVLESWNADALTRWHAIYHREYQP
jgi:hypothetical protein